jgi:hypothetical protein
MKGNTHTRFIYTYEVYQYGGMKTMTNNENGIDKERIDELVLAMLKMTEGTPINPQEVIHTIVYYLGHGKHTKRLIKG